VSETGILWALELDGEGGGRELSWQELRDRDEPRPTWLHLEAASPEVRAWLASNKVLDPAALETFLSAETRPRCMRSSDGLLLFVRGVNLTPGKDPDDMISLRIALKGGLLLVSYRQERMATTHAIHDRLGAGEGPRSVNELFVALLLELTQRIQPVLDNLDDLADALEAELEAGEPKRARADLANLRQQTIALRRYLAPQRVALGALLADPPPWLGPQGLARVREVTDATLRYVEDLEALRERTAVIHDELSTRAADQLNQRMYALAMVSLVFLPLGLLTGLLGINVGGMPGAESPVAFWLVCGLLLVISAAIGGWLRFARWV